jgi:hypothetical protein
VKVQHHSDWDYPWISVSAFYGPSEQEIIVTCDFCDVVWGCQGPEFEVVGGLANDGWITMGAMDFCPECCGGEAL